MIAPKSAIALGWSPMPGTETRGQPAPRPHRVLQPRARPPGGGVVAGLLRLGPGLAEARRVRVHETRIQGLEVAPGEPEIRQHAQRVVGDEHVGLPHQTEQDLARLGVLQVEGDAALAAAGQQPAVVLLALRERRHLVEVAVRVPGLGRLDLHHVGAEVGHHRRRGGAEHEAADVEDAESVENGAHGSHSTSAAPPWSRSERAATSRSRPAARKRASCAMVGRRRALAPGRSGRSRFGPSSPRSPPGAGSRLSRRCPCPSGSPARSGRRGSARSRRRWRARCRAACPSC